MFLLKRLVKLIGAVVDNADQTQPLPPLEVPAGHVRVRIGVSITQTGQWTAWGAIESPDELTRDTVLEGVIDDALVHFVEADIPIPQHKVIEGVVT